VRPSTLLAAFACAAFCSTAALAGPTVQLAASASLRTPNDEMLVTLSVERDSPDVGAANREVLAQVREALEQARKVPGVQARLADMRTQPNWTPRGRAEGWRVHASVVLESLRMPELAELAGRLTRSMQVAGVQFRLSEAARRTLERELLARAGQQFRDKATETARALGYARASLREVSVSESGAGPIPPRPMMAMARAGASAEADMAMPVEGGQAEVSATLSGTVELSEPLATTVLPQSAR
jgi:predicted secreted protein